MRCAPGSSMTAPQLKTLPNRLFHSNRQEYNAKIQEQRKDMEESAKSAERVHNDLQNFRNRSVVIDGQQKCVICEVYLLVKPFFIFPCGHKFHNDCLEHQVTAHLSKNSMAKGAAFRLPEHRNFVL